MRGQVKTFKPRIGIDLLGSDTAPELFLAHVLEFCNAHRESVEFIIFCDHSMKSIASSPHIFCVVAKEVISMEDDPLVAIRRKKESSLLIGMRMLQKKELNAFVSAGNTGALIASAKMALSMLPGIARPALLALMPTQKKAIAVLDVGANVAYKADHLLQFASIGIAYQKTRGIDYPTVGLLNIGTEQMKGTPELRETYKKLQTLNKSEGATFVGNVEGRDVFKGDIDVLVTDGFTGNVFLKTAEGIASFILDQMATKIHAESPEALKETLGELQKKLHHTEFPGAIISGVNGIVVKCHGNATPAALLGSIKGALRLVEHNFLEKIKKQLELDSQSFSFSSLFGKFS